MSEVPAEWGVVPAEWGVDRLGRAGWSVGIHLGPCLGDGDPEPYPPLSP